MTAHQRGANERLVEAAAKETPAEASEMPAEAGASEMPAEAGPVLPSQVERQYGVAAAAAAVPVQL